MNFRALVRLNPNQTEITRYSSQFIMQRGIKPGKGNRGYSIPQFITTADNITTRTADLSDINTYSSVQLIGLVWRSASDISLSVLLSAQALNYKSGLWVIRDNTGVDRHGVGVIGPSGLMATFNTFNAGYRWKRGERPKLI